MVWTFSYRSWCGHFRTAHGVDIFLPLMVWNFLAAHGVDIFLPLMVWTFSYRSWCGIFLAAHGAVRKFLNGSGKKNSATPPLPLPHGKKGIRPSYFPCSRFLTSPLPLPHRYRVTEMDSYLNQAQPDCIVADYLTYRNFAQLLRTN